MSVKYYKPIIDSNGYTHSIDMVKCFYYIGSINGVLNRLQELSKYCKNYYEKLDCSPCVRYHFWKHHLHIDDIYVRLGRFSLKPMEKGDKIQEYTALSLEVNPNKHHDSELLKKVMDIVLDASSSDGYLDQIDYTIDLPCDPDDVVVLGTRKMPGLYKGTRYFGARGQHGFVRIYNKSLESGLDFSLTRVETCLKIGKKFSSIDFGVVNHAESITDKLSNSTGLMVDMLKELQLYGSNIDAYLDRMNYRTRLQVLEHLSGAPVKFEHNPDILDKLINQVKEFFGLSDNPDEQHNLFCEGSDGFLELNEDEIDNMLPF